MPILTLLLITTTPKVQDPETVLHKFDNVAFRDTNLSVRGLNTVEINRKLVTNKQIEVKSYGWWNISNRQCEEGLRLSWRFK